MKFCRICGISEVDGAPDLNIPHPVIEPREILGNEEACEECEKAEKESRAFNE